MGLEKRPHNTVGYFLCNSPKGSCPCWKFSAPCSHLGMLALSPFLLCHLLGLSESIRSKLHRHVHIWGGKRKTTEWWMHCQRAGLRHRGTHFHLLFYWWELSDRPCHGSKRGCEVCLTGKPLSCYNYCNGGVGEGVFGGQLADPPSKRQEKRSERDTSHL